MIHDPVELHNVAEVRRIDGREGVRLQRVPEAVRGTLNERARRQMLRPANTEIRFESDGERVAVTLSCPDADPSLPDTHPESGCTVVPFWGPFQSEPFAGHLHRIGPEPETIELTYPETLAPLDAGYRTDAEFSPRVWRLVCWGAPLHFHGIEGEAVRPPRAEALPDRRYLAYGTSITEGYGATAGHLTYVDRTAARIGADPINLGAGASAHCESGIADYVAGRDDWDLATLELSVNMLDFDLDEVRERFRYLIDEVAGADEDRPVVCLTLLPFFGDVSAAYRDPGWGGAPEDFRATLREVVADVDRPNVHLLEGPELLSDVGALDAGLIHPGDAGMARIAEGLSPVLEELC